MNILKADKWSSIMINLGVTGKPPGPSVLPPHLLLTELPAAEGARHAIVQLLGSGLASNVATWTAVDSAAPGG